MHRGNISPGDPAHSPVTAPKYQRRERLPWDVWRISPGEGSRWGSTGAVGNVPGHFASLSFCWWDRDKQESCSGAPALAGALPGSATAWHSFRTTTATSLSATRRTGGLLVLCKPQNSRSFCHVFENAQCKRTQGVEQSSKVDLRGLPSFKLAQPIRIQ